MSDILVHRTAHARLLTIVEMSSICISLYVDQMCEIQIQQRSVLDVTFVISSTCQQDKLGFSVIT